MSTPFASSAWASALATRLAADPSVKTAAEQWIYGPISFVIDGDSEHEFTETTLRFDIHAGEVRAVEEFAAGEAKLAPFVLRAELKNWRALLNESLPLQEAILLSKVNVQGDLPTIFRHEALFTALATVAETLETVWPDQPVEA